MTISRNFPRLVPELRAWWLSLAIYTDRRILTVLLLGFASGLPLALTAATLGIRLTEAGIDKTTIGLFSLAGIPYTFKFLWAPFMDQLPVPLLTKILGRRRSWMIVTQIALMFSLWAMGWVDPIQQPRLIALLTLATAFFSASQDIVIDAYRVEILDQNQYGAGAAVIVLGYRLGMLVSGAGALYLATLYSWQVTYSLMALFMVVGLLTILFNPEPAGMAMQPHASRSAVRILAWLSDAVLQPFIDFMKRPGWLWILAFILLYKFGDALAGVMNNPFYLEIGFSKIEIANISKVFGLIATILGGILGGVMVHRLGIMKSLIWCGLLQMLSNLFFALLALQGKHLGWLIVTIGVENLSAGMGTAAFVAYLSGLCNIAYTATQYALLSSFMAFGRTLLSSSGGWLADQMSWVLFFLLTTVAAWPGLLLLLWMVKRFPLEKT